MAKLGLPSLQQSRKQQRLQLLMKILGREDAHPALVSNTNNSRVVLWMMSLWEMPGKLYTNQSSVLLWTPYFHANKQQPVLQQLSTKDRTRDQGKRLNIAVSCNVVLQPNTWQEAIFACTDPYQLINWESNFRKLVQKSCFHWHEWGTPLIPVGSLAWTIQRGNSSREKVKKNNK